MVVLAGSKRIIEGHALATHSVDEVRRILIMALNFAEEDVKKPLELILSSGLDSAKPWESRGGEKVDFLDLGKEIGIKDLLLDSHQYGSVVSLVKVANQIDRRFIRSIRQRPIFALTTIVSVPKGKMKGSYVPFVYPAERSFVFGFHSTRELFPDDALFVIRHVGL